VTVVEPGLVATEATMEEAEDLDGRFQLPGVHVLLAGRNQQAKQAR
jgi:hypothetical protein